MRFRKFTAGAAAAALALAPVAAQAAVPLRAGPVLEEANGQTEGGAAIGIIFALVVFAIAIYASEDNPPPVQPPVSP